MATIDPQIPGRHASHSLFDHARVVPNREATLMLKVSEHEAAPNSSFVRYGFAIDANASAPIAGYAERGKSDLPAFERDLMSTILELSDPGARLSEPRHRRIELALALRCEAYDFGSAMANKCRFCFWFRHLAAELGIIVPRTPKRLPYVPSEEADAMWGYRTPRYEHLGKAVARLDDLLNIIPARIGALLVCCVAGRRWRAAWSSWRLDAGRTASPNAGQTMACTAGALGVRLEKTGQYVLNGASPVRDADAVVRGGRLVTRAFWLAAGLSVCIRLAVDD